MSALRIIASLAWRFLVLLPVGLTLVIVGYIRREIKHQRALALRRQRRAARHKPPAPTGPPAPVFSTVSKADASPGVGTHTVHERGCGCFPSPMTPWKGGYVGQW